jgi:hypothetical protein
MRARAPFCAASGALVGDDPTTAGYAYAVIAKRIVVDLTAAETVRIVFALELSP